MELSEFLLTRFAEDKGWAQQELGRRDVILTGPFSPHHILAECVVKQELVRTYRSALELGNEPIEYDAGRQDALGLAARLLALSYADHPDYRSEWKP